MLIIGSILLLLANAVTLRRENSIFFNQVAILILLYSGILVYDILYNGSLDTGIGVFWGIFHSILIAPSNFCLLVSSARSSPEGYLFKVSAAHTLCSAALGRHLPSSKRHYSTGTNNTLPVVLFNHSDQPNSISQETNCLPSPASSVTVLSPLNPWFITGFTDAEGCFSVEIMKDSRNPKKINYNYNLCFKIGLHRRDRALLEEIQKYFGGIGSITVLDENAYLYRVASIKNLKLIIDHFDKYPLITEKLADYLLFKQAFELISRKEHLTKEGLNKLIAIKSVVNKGLSPDLKAVFPNVIPVQRPLAVSQVIQDPHWLAGFVSGEGCFFVNIYKGSTKTGFKVALRFKISQSSRDEVLMKSLSSYLDCGG
jgi:hypothetical protein